MKRQHKDTLKMTADGLKTAKKLAKEHAKSVKGSRDDYARGYRQAIADVVRSLDAEIGGEKPPEKLPKVVEEKKQEPETAVIVGRRFRSPALDGG
jgi:hypothetical protein